MTTTVQPQSVTYAGDGSTSAFAIPFRFLAPSDVEITHTSAAGVSTVTTGTSATVTGTGAASGGTYTHGSAPAVGETLTIRHVPALTQGSSFQSGLHLPTLELVLDGLSYGLMWAERELSHRPRSSGTDLTLPEPADGKVLGWQAGLLVNLSPDGSLSLGDGTVTTAKLVDEAVTAAKIKDATITADKLATSVLAATWTVDVDADGHTLEEVVLQGAREKVAAASFDGSDNIVLDFTAGSVATITLDRDAAGLVVTTADESGTWQGVRLYLEQDGTGSRTVSWPSAVKWPGGQAPTLSTAAGAVDVIVLGTFDEGVTLEGQLVAQGLAGLSLS